MVPTIKYRFGAFEACVRTRELYKHGLKIKLRPQPFRVLQLLLEHTGDVVTREELRKILWPSETFVDFEHGLNTSIKELRGALGDSASEPHYIQTLPKLGYRLITPVEKECAVAAIAVGEQAAPSVPVNPAPLPATDSARPSVAIVMGQSPAASRRYLRVMAAATVLLLLVATGDLLWQRAIIRVQAPSGRVMLAVLPFENLTGDSEQDYFSDGLTEEMLTELGNLDPQHLGVIARTSVMHYKGSSANLEQIGRELGVDYVIEGSVRRDAQTVRITAQLIKTRDQTHIWARQYDRQLTSLLVLQSEIAEEVADEIGLSLGQSREGINTSKTRTLPNSYEAYDLYLRGRYFWNKRFPYFTQAAHYFQKAIDKDPNYAPAYAGLADTYALMSTWQEVPQNEFMPKARAAALKALQIDERLADAHTSLALISESYDYDWQTAEKEYRRAIQLDPAYATAHHWYAECLMYEGRFEEALSESQRAREIDPFSLIIATDRGAILYYARRYNEAMQQLRSVLAMDPDFLRANGIFNGALTASGRFAEAEAYIEKHRATLGESNVLKSQIFLYGHWGRQAQARSATVKLNQLLNPSQHPSDPYINAAFILADVETNQLDAAMALLEKEYAAHSTSVLGLKVDPIYDPLRSDPRFEDLLHRVGLLN